VLLPALDAGAALPAYLWCWSQRRFQATVFGLLAWAAAKGAAMVVMTVMWPARAAQAVAFGGGYADGMMTWLRFGADVATGSTILKAAAATVAASVVSGGAGGLVVAATLVNCHAYYIGTLFLQSVAAARVVVFGTPVWYFFLAAGLAQLLVAGAEPLAALWRPRPAATRDALAGLAMAAIMLVAAYAAAGWLAPLWRDQLAPGVIFDAEALFGK